jgi:hypothetical protein
MRIAVAINRNHPNYNTFLAFLSQFSIIDSNLSIDIVSYSKLEEIYGLVNKKCSYILIMQRYCFIDINKLYLWILSKKPNIAGLSSHKGIGYPYFLLCKTSLFKPLSKLETLSPKDETENYFMNIIKKFMKDKKYTTFQDAKILSLDQVSYLANCNYVTGIFHKSIFTGLSDMDKNFSSTMSTLSSGIKEVYYNQELYKLKIGKSFFIYKYWNFAILPNRTVLVWSAIKNDWVVANKTENKILQQILTKE